MDQTQTSQAAQTKARQKMTDAIVLVAMGLVAIAISFAVNVQFGLSASRAVIAGVLIFALLAGAHFLLVPRASKTEDTTELEDEELWRALKEQRRNAPDAKRIAMATRVEHVEPTPEAAPTLHAAGPQSEPVPSHPVLSDPVASGPVASGTGSNNAEAALTAQRPAHVPRRKARILSKRSGVDPATAAPASADMPEPDSYGSYRPGNDALAESIGAEATSQMATPAPERATGTPSAHPVPVLDLPDTEDGSTPAHAGATDGTTQQPKESDVELVQSMIKDLAHRVNARDVLEPTTPSLAPQAVAPGATASEANPQAPSHQAPSAHTPSRPHQQQVSMPDPAQVQPDVLQGQPVEVAASPQIIAQSAAPAAPQHHEPTHVPELSQPPVPSSSPATMDLVTASVGALRETADVMREADDAAPEGAPQVNQPVRPAMHPDAADVAQGLYAALNAGQVGVLLEPIVTLNDMRPDHYEVRLQVAAPQGADIEGSSIERDLQATGVLADMDLERLMKAISVGELLRERGKSGSLLTRIYRESLLDRDFCFTVATSGVANEVLAQHMVLTLTQDAVRTLTAAEWQTLSEFRELGYRFAVSHVQDLDMDFTQLMAAGFTFVKLHADAFLDGSFDADAGLSSHDLTRYLAQSGLAVIVDGIDSTDSAAEALAMGAGLGQGAITGGPRLMKAEAVANEDHAVA